MGHDVVNNTLNKSAEKDVLELTVSQSHVKPSTMVKVSWKLPASVKLTYKEVIVIADVSPRVW